MFTIQFVNRSVNTEISVFGGKCLWLTRLTAARNYPVTCCFTVYCRVLRGVLHNEEFTTLRRSLCRFKTLLRSIWPRVKARGNVFGTELLNLQSFYIQCSKQKSSFISNRLHSLVSTSVSSLPTFAGYYRSHTVCPINKNGLIYAIIGETFTFSS